MTVVNMHDAKTRLSKLVAAIRSGEEREVVIAVNGTPAARLVPIEPRPKVKWGLLKGKIAVPDNIDELNPEIEKLFYGEAD
jgi:prevent-host-death family protein